MQHVQAKNICDAGIAKWKFLCVCDCIQPGTPDQIGRENVWRGLFEKPRPRSDFDGKATRFAERKKPRKEFFLVDAPQRRFSLPDAAVPQKLLMSLGILGHSVFRLY